MAFSFPIFGTVILFPAVLSATTPNQVLSASFAASKCTSILANPRKPPTRHLLSSEKPPMLSESLIKNGSYDDTQGTGVFLHSLFSVPGDRLQVMKAANTERSRIIECRSLAGYVGHRYFKLTLIDNNHYRVEEIRRDQTPWMNPDALIEPLKTNISLSEEALPELARVLASSQSNVTHNDRLRIMDDIVKANDSLLRRLKAGQPLDLDFIENLNLLVRSSSSQQEKHFHGIIRGTKKLIKGTDGRTYLADLTQLQIGGGIVNFVPAEQVPARLNEWIDRANRIDRESSLREVVNLYQNFILIHPFADGNGRTSRLLLDYMALKAGFPPVPHSKKAESLTRDVIRYSDDVLLERFIKAYK